MYYPTFIAKLVAAPGISRKRFVRSTCLVLAAITFAVYWPAIRHGFISFDDDQYITDNPHVYAGLTWPGAVWAFQSGYAANWHPVTWLSHMMDCQLFGLQAGGHHLTSLLLHIANTLLVFFWLNQATGARWRSALAAALFAWHPLHVESVAWASERKDVLSAFFFLLTLLAYTRHAQGAGSEGRSPKSEVRNSGCWFWYCAALVLFALGLMSKPMLVTLPFLLLLLDIWPLQRFEVRSSKFEVQGSRLSGPDQTLLASSPAPSGVAGSRLLPLMLEKAPFLALALADSVITFLVQKTAGAVSSMAVTPIHLRFENVLVSYVRYVSKTFWPVDLAVFYPYPARWPLPLVVTAAFVLLAWTTLVLLCARRRPYLGLGWLWFVGTLVPAIGLVQVGSQSMADRYMYLPSIGLFIFVLWGVNDLRRYAGQAWAAAVERGASTPGGSRRFWQSWSSALLGMPALSCATVVMLAACAVCCSSQLRHWRTSVSLFRHAIEVTSDNHAAWEGLGTAYCREGQKQAALICYAEAVRLNPHVSEAQYDYGSLLMDLGRVDEAVVHLSKAVADAPNFVRGQNNLGNALLKQGKTVEAMFHLAKAIQLAPDFLEARFNLGKVLLDCGRLEEAAAQLSAAVKLSPKYADARATLGVALARQGRRAEALLHFTEAVRLAPDNADNRFNLGLALLEEKQPALAATNFEAGIRLRPEGGNWRFRLAQAYEQTGRFPEAARAAQKARELALAVGQQELASQASEMLRRCQTAAPQQQF
jgi:tetratricopeptide (TPR) repeat protein